jgi:hypothetical protein
MAFACTAWPKKQRIFAAVDERSGCQIKHHTAIQFRIEGEVKDMCCSTYL